MSGCDVRPPVNNRYVFLNARGRVMSPDGFAILSFFARAMLAVPSVKKAGNPASNPSLDRSILHATGDDPEGLDLARPRRPQDHRVPSTSPAARNWKSLRSTRRHTIRPAFPGAKDSLMSILAASDDTGLMPSESV